jgi:uncharacterized protein
MPILFSKTRLNACKKNYRRFILGGGAFFKKNVTLFFISQYFEIILKKTFLNFNTKKNMMGLMIISVVMSVIGMLISGRLQRKFKQYAQVPLTNGMSGKEVAEAMLRHYGIYDVQVLPANGFLTDHYNPADKTVNLSEAVYHERSVAAAAVAAHECGHAVQHATAYSMLQMRSAIVPAVQFASTIQQYLFMASIFATGMLGGKIFLMIAVGVFGVTALFSLITLPVEFDASRRALVWLDQSGVARGQAYDGAKDALTWAAMTYVAAALAALVSLLYLVMQLLGSDD